MEIFQYRNIEAKYAEKGSTKTKVRWLVTKEIGAKNFAMRLFEMEAGGHSPLHNHLWEHAVFILEGEGTVISEKGKRKFKAGDAIFIPPNEKHQFRNDDKKVVKFICIVPYTDEYSKSHTDKPQEGTCAC